MRFVPFCHKKVIKQSNARHKKGVIYKAEYLSCLEDVTLIELKSICGSCGVGEIRDVSFRLPNGKIYGVFSPRYEDAICLLALMAGARTPTGGAVLVGGFDLHREAKQARKTIAYLPPRLLPDEELTPIEYLMSVADMYELSYDKTLRRVYELLELADLADKKERLIAHLSYGEKRILCMLQLLLGKPETLILSSPFSGILPKNMQKVRSLIQYLGEGRTVFLCTPNAKDLCEICEDLLVLENGTLKMIAPIGDSNLQEALNVPMKEVPAPEAPAQKSKSTRWRMLMQGSGDYEVIDTDGKEDKK